MTKEDETVSCSNVIEFQNVGAFVDPDQQPPVPLDEDTDMPRAFVYIIARKMINPVGLQMISELGYDPVQGFYPAFAELEEAQFFLAAIGQQEQWGIVRLEVALLGLSKMIEEDQKKEEE